jgi:tight adherence protein C
MEYLKELERKLRQWNVDRKRLPQIAAALPEAIDLIVLVMRAGLDFQVALGQYLERGPEGPLRDELARMQAEVRTGTPRLEALRRLHERVHEPSLQETVRTIIQGIELGSSLTPILRVQAQALRKTRFYQAEKRAAVAPLKLMFPLFVFIFPTLFIVLFGPLILTFVQKKTGS